MDREVEHELCGNCKKEIPQHNYVMHTAHCGRNITLCKTCNEPFPKLQFEEHKKTCEKPRPVKKPSPPPTTIEKSSYFQQRKAIEDQKAANRKERYMQKHERLVDTGYSLKSGGRQNSVDRTTADYGSPRSVRATPPPLPRREEPEKKENKPPVQNGALPRLVNPPPKSSGMLACKYCDLELPKLDLEEHENYCGSRTDKCLECGELVMFKYKQIHMDSNHGFLKLKDEPGPRPSWDSTTQRSPSSSNASSISGLDSLYTPRRRPPPLRPLADFDYDPLPYMPQSYSVPGAPGIKIEKGESYKEISRRLDCPAPQPPRRRNPPTEITIACEFCGTPFPHEDLIDHENICRLARRSNVTIPCEFCNTAVLQEDLILHQTGCRPDLARRMPRRHRSPEEDDYFIAPQPSSPEVELPCEFCADMIPASQLLRHQAACS